MPVWRPALQDRAWIVARRRAVAGVTQLYWLLAVGRYRDWV